MHADCKNLIGASWQAGAKTAPNLSPADTTEVLGTAPVSGREEAEAAVAAAKQAFPGWASTPAPARGQILFKLVRLLERDQDKLAEALSREEGKLFAEAKGEVGKGIRYVEFAAGDARRMTGITAASELPGTLAMTIWRPHGVVALITPWNFPVAIPLWKMAPALVAGNTVVLKPAPETPMTAQLIGELCLEAGFPPGVVNIVHGDAEPAKALIDLPDVKAVSFTGSTEVGLKIEARCAELHKLVQCELGGKNALIVLDDCDLELAIAACAMGAFGSTGQRCTATSRAIVMDSIADEFVAGVVAKAKAIQAGHPMDAATGMGPSVSERQLAQVLHYMEVGVGEADLKVGGTRLTEGALGRGFFPAPTVFDKVRPDARIAMEEIFGPVLSVVRVKDLDEALSVANRVRYGLTGSVFTKSLANAFQVIERLDAGMTHINNPTVGGEAHLPFGGIKDTAVGPREMGPEAWKFYAEQKVAYVNHVGAPRKGNLY